MVNRVIEFEGTLKELEEHLQELGYTDSKGCAVVPMTVRRMGTGERGVGQKAVEIADTVPSMWSVTVVVEGSA
jgi:hypothetical protein